MHDYAGTHYQYDARGNLIEKLHNGQRSRFEWDLFNRLTGYNNDTLHVSYQYDALGRRLIKQSEAHGANVPACRMRSARKNGLACTGQPVAPGAVASPCKYSSLWNTPGADLQSGPPPLTPP
ncbi:hypothetical protein ACFWP0_00035 [Achromobacter sp. NPDC058515]|uniref:hypothetical protein n=1 Tax=Achromobacter sp. NPDC058515 TaxID=3346533 RepID=UPI0036501658